MGVMALAEARTHPINKGLTNHLIVFMATKLLFSDQLLYRAKELRGGCRAILTLEHYCNYTYSVTRSEAE